MAFKTAPRVFETSITTGTGDYTLAGAVTGYQSFASGIGNANTCEYFVEDGTNWEEGIATILTGPNRLQRTTITGSSNGGAAVNWGAGTRNLYCGLTARRSLLLTGERGSVAMHATTMDLWTNQPNVIDGTGSAVTITAIANAPQAGASRVLYPITGTIITNGATFAVDGAANYTSAAGDKFEFEAITTSTYKVHITKKDGTVVSVVSSGFTTGDVKLTIKTSADTGWVLMDDKTIGNAASGATGRANADTVDLYTLLYNNTADAQCAVSTGRGANAAADYAANKTIALPKALGRALATYGAGSGLTSRAMALTTGVETHPLVTGELAAHTHAYGSTSAGVGTPSNIGNATGDGTLGFNTTSTGSGTAHQNMQPTLFLNTMIKI